MRTTDTSEATTATPRLPIRAVRLGERVSVPYTPRAALVGALLVLAAVGVALLAVTTGEFVVPLSEVLAVLTGRGSRASEFIVLQLRLPRVVTALLVGAAMGASGAVFQSLTRNPLGSPDVVGFNAGAAAGAVAAITLFRAGLLAVAGAALAGGLATALVVHLVAWRRGVAGYRLVLVGLGVGAMLTSLTEWLLIRAQTLDAHAAAVWLVGSLNGRGWDHALTVGVASAVLLPSTLLLGRRLRLLELGDDVASGVGVPVEATRVLLMALAVGLAAVATVTTGPVLFIALAAPQLAARLARTPGPGLVTSAAMGALLLAASDVVAQRLLAPTQLPVGIVTGALGGCYLGWLLLQERRAGRL